MGDKLNGIMGRLNRLMKDIDDYNNENKDKINVGMYLNYKGTESKYNNRIYYYRNMEKNKMSELMNKERDVKKYVLGLNKNYTEEGNKLIKPPNQENNKYRKTEIKFNRKNDGKIIVLKDRANH